MNKFIKAQLEKLKNVPEFDETTTHLVFAKGSLTNNQVYSTKLEEYELGKAYVIEVEDYIIHPYPAFTLHQNWNNNIIPTDKNMIIRVIQLMGKMMKVNARGMNDNSTWEGWLPIKSCKLKELIKE